MSRSDALGVRPMLSRDPAERAVQVWVVVLGVVLVLRVLALLALQVWGWTELGTNPDEAAMRRFLDAHGAPVVGAVGTGLGVVVGLALPVLALRHRAAVRPGRRTWLLAAVFGGLVCAMVAGRPGVLVALLGLVVVLGLVFRPGREGKGREPDGAGPK